MSKDYEAFVQAAYIEPRRVPGLDADSEAYNLQECLLWIEHSSPACYWEQVAVEHTLSPGMGLNRLAKKYTPLARRAAKEYKQQVDSSFRVCVEDVAAALARDYLSGHRREGPCGQSSK